MKITVQHDEDNYQFRFAQEGKRGLIINEGYLEFFFRVLQNEEYHNTYYYGSFRVHKEGRSTIITVFNKKTPGWLPVLIFNADQVKKLKEALESNFSFVLSEYSVIRG